MFTTFSLAVILDCTARIVLGTALGALIGLERQLRARSAGIRTNALVALGSTLFVLVSELAVAGGSSGDPTRVAAQVASGIGFLCAGVILKHGASVSGLNTAATLWASAAVGTRTGSGDLVIAIIGAVMVVLANPLFRAIGSFIDRRRSINDYETVGHEYTFEVRCLQQHEVKIRSLVFDAVHRPGFSVRSIAATDLPDDIVSITAVLDTTKRNDADIEKSIEAVIQTPEVLGVRWDVEHITPSD